MEFKDIGLGDKFHNPDNSEFNENQELNNDFNNFDENEDLTLLDEDYGEFMSSIEEEPSKSSSSIKFSISGLSDILKSIPLPKAKHLDGELEKWEKANKMIKSMVYKYSSVWYFIDYNEHVQELKAFLLEYLHKKQKNILDVTDAYIYVMLRNKMNALYNQIKHHIDNHSDLDLTNVTIASPKENSIEKVEEKLDILTLLEQIEVSEGHVMKRFVIMKLIESSILELKDLTDEDRNEYVAPDSTKDMDLYKTLGYRSIMGGPGFLKAKRANVYQMIKKYFR